MPQTRGQGRRTSGSSKQSTSRARSTKASSGTRNGQRKATTRARGGSASAARTRASRNGSGSSAPKKTAARVQDTARNASAPKAALVAAATAAAGVAGTLVATRSRRQRKVLGVPVGRRGGFSVRDLMPSNGGLKTDVRKVAGRVNGVAQQADRLGKGVSRVATTVQNISEGANKGAKE